MDVSDIKGLFAEVKKRMDTQLEHVRRELAGVRTGRASVNILDTVHVEAYGSSMPVVTLQASNLTYGPARYWQVTVSITSNVNRTIDTQVQCTFLNAGRSVGEAYFGPIQLAAGEQASTDLIGPPTTAFVDSTNCRVMNP